MSAKQESTFIRAKRAWIILDNLNKTKGNEISKNSDSVTDNQ